MKTNIHRCINCEYGATCERYYADYSDCPHFLPTPEEECEEAETNSLREDHLGDYGLS